MFKQLKSLYWPDLLSLLGLLCASSSVYCAFKHLLPLAYGLLFGQLIFDYFDGKLARKIGGGALGAYLDSFSDFMAVAASVVFGWFVGIENVPMYIAGFLNISAAAVRLAYFSVNKTKVVKYYTGIPTVVAAVIVTTIAYAGYLFAKPYIHWFAVFYFLSAVSMISDLRVKKI